jgi:enoyl-CoA hydratase/carnithine racemase
MLRCDGGMSAFEVTHTGQIAVLRLVRPPVNALGFADWSELRTRVAELERSDAGAVVLTGAPAAHLSAGNDHTEFGPGSPHDIEQGTAAVADAIRAVRELSKPCVAAIHGAAMGSALLLVCMCDIRIATPDARLGLPEIRVGAFGGYRLAREVLPVGEARMMVLTGRSITGQRAYELGLVQELLPTAEQVLERSVELAGEITGLLTGTLRQEAKPLLNQLDDRAGLWEGHDLERQTTLRFMTRSSGPVGG